MQRITVWHGTEDDLSLLRSIVNVNCECGPVRDGVAPETCPAHRMLLDQTVLDRLDFTRHISVTLTREEWLIKD